MQAAGLAAGYGRRIVWAGASFDVGPGELVAVLGPNGSGKTTLVRLVLGLIAPAAGRLHVMGAPPRRGHPAIGYVAQRGSLAPQGPVVAASLVGLGVDGHRWGLPLPGAAADRKARAVSGALSATGALGYANRPVDELSGGQRQRLALAQALVGEPRLLVLDEPLAGLDVTSQAAIAELVASLTRLRGLATLLIAHDVNPLLPHVDRVVYIAGGRVAAGAVEAVIASGPLTSLYGSPVEVLRDSRGRRFVVGAGGSGESFAHDGHLMDEPR